MVKKAKFKHPRLLPSDRTVSPVFPDLGDEIFQNGVFFFNVSAILKWLEQNPQPIGCVPADIWGSFPYKEDRHVEAADLNRPIVIAEIAPAILLPQRSIKNAAASFESSQPRFLHLERRSPFKLSGSR